MQENGKCLYCEISSQEIPLVRLLFRGEEILVCPQHLPLLIHEPQKLIGKLPGADRLIAYQPD